MISKGAFTQNLDTFKAKTWRLSDQVAAFSINYTPSSISLASLVKPVIIPFNYDTNGLKSGHVIEGQGLTESLLNQAIEYFQKALYNFNCHYILAKQGYHSWASVTNYYSSYFSIFSLLSLQGRAITRVDIGNNGQLIPCLIYPIDLRKHEYVITTKEGADATHKLPWRRYYDVYNSYQCLKPQFDVIQQSQYVTEPIIESEERNRINYKIYEGFQEVIDVSNITTFKTNYMNTISIPALGDVTDSYLNTLRSLATDPDFKFFARSALRLVLIKVLFDQIGNSNNSFKTAYISRIPIIKQSLFDIYSPPANYFEDFANTFLI
ncbi:MAG TPA: hypothetical protein VD794_10930 [Flavisolibacter sp.]|nr:hypothetical protein [Flavisolibacter sp.]